MPYANLEKLLLKSSRQIKANSNWLKTASVIIFFSLTVILRSMKSNALHVPNSRKPIWNIAHMVNSIREIPYNLRRGANAVEADVTFANNGTPIETYHGPPCDCLRLCNQREPFIDYLKYVRVAGDPAQHSTTFEPNLTLVFFDLKLWPLSQRSKANAGIKLAEVILEHLYDIPVFDFANRTQAEWFENKPAATSQQFNGSKDLRTLEVAHSTPIEQSSTSTSYIYTVLSINHVTDVDLVLNFMSYLEEAKRGSNKQLATRASLAAQHVGWDVGMNDNIKRIEAMWRRYFKDDPTINIWQGDGFTNCISPLYNLARLTQALEKRDQFDYYQAPVGWSKVYQWTIDLHDRLREALRMGTDAVMTNHPERLVNVLNEHEFRSTLRLATRDDNPFERIITKRSGVTSELAELESPAASSSSELFRPIQSIASPDSVVTERRYREGLSGTMSDIFSSVVAYFRDIIYLSYPGGNSFGIRNTGHINNKVANDRRLSTDSQSSLDNHNSRTSATETTIMTISQHNNNNNTNLSKSNDQSNSNNWMGHFGQFLGKVLLILVQDTLDEVLQSAHNIADPKNSTLSSYIYSQASNQPIYYIQSG
ncbi:hypothetical protein GZH46_02177, partial [Fragariocoptes setiger]